MSRERKKRSYCIVDLCTNEGNHLFPKDESRKAQWMQAIRHFKRGLTVRQSSRICSAHFKPNDFRKTPLTVLQPNVIKILNKTAIPSIFPWKTAFQPQTYENQGPSSYAASSEPAEQYESLTLNLSQIEMTYARTPRILFVEVQPYFNNMPCDTSEDPLTFGIENAESNGDHSQQFSELVSNTGIEIGEKLITEIDIAED